MLISGLALIKLFDERGGSQLRNIGIILFVVICGFGITIFNGFVGDDHMLFSHNTFYQNINNIPRIFTPRFVTQDEITLSTIGIAADMDSGLVSYRPTAIVHYFIDYALFGQNPAGYHLFNVLWHAFNCVLVYLIVYYLTFNAPQALLVALLFAVHPTRSEPVSVISYRNDLIVTAYLLMSFLMYLRFRKTGNQMKFFLVSVLFFCLGVFAKEYAVLFPIIIIIYDWMFNHRSMKNLRIYGVFFAISGFYLWIYKCIVPNGVFGHTNNPVPWLDQFLHVGWNAVLYIRDIFLPWDAKIWPPQTMPPFLFSNQITLIIISLVFIIFWGLFLFFLKKSRLISFFLLWSFLFWIPVSNLVILPNPISQRFFYFPSLGLIFVVVAGLMWFVNKVKEVKILPSFGLIFYGFIIGMCLVFIVPMNGLWKNDFMIGSYWLESFQPSVKTLSIMGINHVAAHDNVRAKELLLRAYAMDNNDFDSLMMLSKIEKNNPVESRKYLARLVSLYPPNFLTYYSVGETYFIEKNYSEALIWFNRTLNIRKEKNVFGMIIYSLIHLGENEKAKACLKEANKFLTSTDFLLLSKELSKIQDEEPTLVVPKL